MAGTSRRERKKSRTRDELIRAALGLVQERGFEATTVDDIVEAADYSRATFFRHFPSKEDVFFIDLPDRVDALQQVQGAPEDVDPWLAARTAVAEQVLGFTAFAPDVEAACVRLWFSEAALYRRYLELVARAEDHLTDFFQARLAEGNDDVSARVLAEEALRRSKEDLHELASAAHRAREQEKSRIARELHDELGQQLTALQMDVAWCRDKTPSNQEAMASRLARMEALLETTVAATRRISADLRPLMLDDLGLQPALEWLVESFTEHTGVRCELAAGDGELDLPDLQATAVFRTVQESLTNIAKHARASRVDVAVEQRDSELTISVRDDGVGFSPQDSRKPNSYGLLGLRERAALLGGDARVTSAPGRGTHVEVRFPIALEMGRS